MQVFQVNVNTPKILVIERGLDCHLFSHFHSSGFLPNTKMQMELTSEGLE